MSNIPDFETICRHKDGHSSNLNDVFSTYGCSTLEAKVPVVERPVVEQIKQEDPGQQTLAALALRSESASWAMKGRAPRTRNKELRIVEVNGDLILEAGKERDRSPVDRDELDDELNTYMQEAARRKAQKQHLAEQTDRLEAMRQMEDL